MKKFIFANKLCATPSIAFAHKNVMKRFVQYVLFFSFSIVFYSCDNSIEHESNETNDPPTTYSEVVETTEFTLPSGCRWIYTIPDDKHSDVSIINSQEELRKFLSCGDEDVSSIDFNKKSLLLAYGDTLSRIHKHTYQLFQPGEEDFQLEIEIQTSTDVWQEGWIISVLIPKVPQNTIVKLKESENNDEQQEETNNPYLDDIVGTWKLSFYMTENDSLFCLNSNIIYDFQKDGKLIVSNSTTEGLKPGEYTYEYTKPNICMTCPPVSNLRIGSDDEMFCEAYPLFNTMAIWSTKTENGQTIINNYSILIRAENDNPNDNDEPKDDNIEQTPND